MATIAITGISGFLGQRVHEQLRADGHTVVGVDLRPPQDTVGLVFHEADVRSRPDVERALAQVDGVVHLATATRAGSPDHSVNVGGSQVVVDAAVAAGVDTLVVMSSAMVYGAHPDNAVPLDEDAPLRADPDFTLAAQKVMLEHMVAPLLDADQGPRTVVLRPAMVVGADADNLLTRALQGSRLLVVKGHTPPVQFVHVDDVAAAIALAVRSDMAGAYNVACEGWLANEELRGLLHHRVLEVPEEIAFAATDRSHAMRLSRLPASALPWVMWPWVVAVDRLLEVGWRPSISNRDAAALLAAEQAATVSLAGVEADRATVRRAGIAVGMVGGVLTIGALARRRWATPDATEAGDPGGGRGGDAAADLGEGGPGEAGSS